MHSRRRYQRKASGVAFNFTPLIDVMMLLTIFFMLVARFTSAEQLAMLLPDPPDSLARVSRMPERVVINCRLNESQADPDAVVYSLGPNPPESLGGISDHLAALQQQTPNIKVVIRADRRLRFEHVRAAMQAVARNNIEVLHVAAIAEERG